MKESSKRTMMALFITGTVIGGAFVGTANAHIVTNVNHTWGHIKGKADPWYAANTYYRSEPFTVSPGNVSYGEIICPGLTYPTGGGAYTSQNNMSMEASYPVDLDASSNGAGFDGWGVYVRNNAGGNGTFRVYVVCQYAAFQDGNYNPGDPAGTPPADR